MTATTIEQRAIVPLMHSTLAPEAHTRLEHVVVAPKDKISNKTKSTVLSDRAKSEEHEENVTEQTGSGGSNESIIITDAFAAKKGKTSNKTKSTVLSDRAPAMSQEHEENVTEHTASAGSNESIIISAGVTNSFVIKEPLISNLDKVYGVILTPLDCSFDTVVSAPERRKCLQRVIQEQAVKHSTDVTVVFAIRYLACPSCREHGRQLSDYLANHRKVALIGVVKEGYVRENVDTNTKKQGKSVLQFYQEYFRRNEIYQGEKSRIFQALGGRRLSLLDSPCKFQSSCKRYKENKIFMGRPSFGLDPMVMGGVLIFDKHGILRFSLHEDFGKEIDVEALGSAIKEARKLGRRHSSLRKD